MEILRDDDELLSRFGQASMSKAYPGVIKAIRLPPGKESSCPLPVNVRRKVISLGGT